MAPKYDVIVVGAGPAGIFAALEIVRRGGGLKVLVLEKGHDLERRHCPSKEGGGSCRHCSPCSMVSGWGGAGAFSDGKLTLSSEVGGWLSEYIPEREVEELISYVDGIYRSFGAPEKVYGGPEDERIAEIQRKAVLADLKLIPAPIRHLGTGRTQEILKAMKDYLLEKGVEVRTDEPVEEIVTKGGRVAGVVTKDGQEISSRYVILAPGRQGADWLRKVANRLRLELAVNPVDVGVRVEVPAVVMEHLTDVIYESKFIFYSRKFDDRVRTFCMNPHGEVVLENNEGLVTVNGHSYADKKTENTNFALLVSKTFTEPFKEPIAYGRYIAGLANLLGGGVLVQRLGDLLAGRRTTHDRLSKGLVTPTLKEATPGDLSLVFPYRHLTAIVEMLEAMDKIAPGVYSRHTLLYGVEVKFYSSRLKLNSNLMTEVDGLYAIGDGAGVTRGLAQASAAGVIAARDILSREAKG
ncbi:MAG: NAD(P)/FAD-dependent oxidoreductase [Thermanaeromonas sp.]|uniref:NAD(P)/FAD-dependent oxidoreductase n=1 Tax=Thermanaeromonas sp. TaxID=2003697 RepID=UPI00243AC3A9|nr:NAD(P)/FAD-dependent oxidoreductase [Thermanaeromonas sp.]MCG0277133.1 NAD(P)/FAD-dependent oxidoreductase [Thermanaeromonas sp.]